MIIWFLKIFLILVTSNLLLANNSYFEEGLNLFKSKEYLKAKFKFEQDIVFNPKVKCHIYIYQKSSII